MGSSMANLIYLKSKKIMKTSVSLSYSSVPRPADPKAIVEFDKGYEFYLNKVGFFTLGITYNIQANKLSLSGSKDLREHTAGINSLLEELSEEELELEGISKDSSNFYSLSLHLYK